MPDEKGELREINYRQVMPWIELFRAFRVSLGFKKLLLAAAGIVVMSLGWWVLALIFSPAGMAENDAAYKDFWKNYLGWTWSADRGPNPIHIIRDPSQDTIGTFAYKGVGVLIEPLVKFVLPVVHVLFPPDVVREPVLLVRVFLVLVILWTLATWAIFGGAITRIAAVQVARKEEKVGLVEALQFAWAKFLSFFSAPLIPFIGVLVASLFMILGGLFLHIPWVGDFLAAVFWPLALAGGIFMAFVLIGMVGWPLMYSTISTEGSDSFDAISRSYSYVYQRPWYYLFYMLIALLYGILVIFFVIFATSLFVALAKMAVGFTPFLGWRAPPDPVNALFVWAPESYHWRDLLLTESASQVREQMSGGQLFAAGIMSFWLHLVFLLMVGFAYSYFWSASTIVYFLLRKNVDDTDLDEVYLEEEDEEAQAFATAAATGAGPTTLPMVEPPRGAAPEPAKMAPEPAPPTPTPAPAPPPAAPDGGNSEGNGNKPPAI